MSAWLTRKGHKPVGGQESNEKNTINLPDEEKKDSITSLHDTLLEKKDDEIKKMNQDIERLELQLRESAKKEGKFEAEKKAWETRSKHFKQEIAEKDELNKELEVKVHEYKSKNEMLQRGNEKYEMIQKGQKEAIEEYEKVILELKQQLAEFEMETKLKDHKIQELSKQKVECENKVKDLEERNAGISKQVRELEQRYRKSCDEKQCILRHLEESRKACQCLHEEKNELLKKILQFQKDLNMNRERNHLLQYEYNKMFLQQCKFEDLKASEATLRYEKEVLKKQKEELEVEHIALKKRCIELTSRLQTDHTSFVEGMEEACGSRVSGECNRSLKESGVYSLKLDDTIDEDGVPNIPLEDKLIDSIVENIPAPAVRPLGTELGFRDSQISHFEANNKNIIENAIRAMFVSWRTKNGNKATTKQLYSHIENIGEKIDRDDIKKTIRNYVIKLKQK